MMLKVGLSGLLGLPVVLKHAISLINSFRGAQIASYYYYAQYIAIKISVRMSSHISWIKYNTQI